MKRNILIMSTILLAVVTLLVANPRQDDHEKIIGTWIAEGDTRAYRWVFMTDKKCRWYSDNKLTDTFTYRFSTTSPQCGYTVDVGPLFQYLELVNVDDPEDKYCYEVTTLSNKYLGLIYIGGAGYRPTTFEKQQ